MLSPLSAQNVIQYLQKTGLLSLVDGKIETFNLPGTNNHNDNLVVKLEDNRQLLVKQKKQIATDGIPQEFFNEWLFQQLLQKFPVLGNISAIAPLVLHCDEENAILVRSYLSEYLDLSEFYYQKNIFPAEIATAIGTTLAALHRATFQHQEYRRFMATAPQGQFRYGFYNPAQGISSISPETVGKVPSESLQFYTLYQRYESLEAAIADLAYEWKPCCLTHNDASLQNILIHSRWNQLDNCLIRLIDWEACGWGDPAFDMGTLLASYLELWLSSLIVDATLNIEESLQLATTPLAEIQPSLVALLTAYLQAFPMILEDSSDFVIRSIKFTGLALIHQIENKIKNCQYFDNADIYKLELAKNILTMPEQSLIKVLGVEESAITSSLNHINQISHPGKEKQLIPLYYEKTRLRGC